MQSTARRTALGSAACALLVLALAGCSEPRAVPIDKRAPGQDISASDRADKRGDIADPQTAPNGK